MGPFLRKKPKIQWKIDGQNHHKGDKQLAETKKRKKLVHLVVGSYLTHGSLMSLARKSWDLIVMGGLEQTSPINVIFSLYNRS
jgi:hypothetical protein